MSRFKISIAAALCLMLVGCSSGQKKAEIASTATPSDEIARIEAEINKAYASHADVLASSDLEKSQSYLKEAKDDLNDGDSPAEVLESLSYSQGYLNSAMATSNAAREKITGVTDARQKAIDAGAREFGPTEKQMAVLDDNLRDVSDKIGNLKASTVTDMQNGYLVVELNAIKMKQLGKAGAQIDAAKRGNAAKYSPAILKQAEVDLKSAENLIIANRNATDTYAAAVVKANRSARLLTAILTATNGGRIDEGTATRVVMQDRKIANMEGELNEAGSKEAVMGEALAKQGRSLTAAGAEINLQKSLAAAQHEFGQDEADVFQQGNNLVIRLKSMNFSSGRSEVPASALPVLEKVKNVAEQLNAKTVMVEGHTDSVGAANLNRTLSEARAEAIAKYLETNGFNSDQVKSAGFGFEKPIASNKSKAGRAQNRRVDIVITPNGATATE